MGPQCAILEWLLAWLRRYRGIAPADLQPFLEIGAFTAHLSGYLATTHGLRGFCGDVDTAIVERSVREVLPRLGMRGENLTPVAVNASALDFADGAFGFVFCFSTLHHFESPLACLREIRRVPARNPVACCGPARCSFAPKSRFSRAGAARAGPPIAPKSSWG
jgi:SAM-dependent methyltransferase